MSGAGRPLKQSLLQAAMVFAAVVGASLLGVVLSALGMSGDGVAVVLVALLLVFCGGAARVGLPMEGGRSGTLAGAETLSVFGIAAIIGGAFSGGGDGLMVVIGLAAGFPLSLIVLAPGNAVTSSRSVPDFLSLRYRSEAVRYLILGIVAAATVLVVAAQLSAVGWFGSGLGVTARILIGALAILLVALPFGPALGARRILALFALIGLSVVAVWLVAAKTGIAVPQLAAGGLLRELGALEAVLGFDPATRTQIDGGGIGAVLVGAGLGFGAAVFMVLTARGGTAHPQSSFGTEMRRGVLVFVLVATALPALGVLAKVEVLKTLALSQGGMAVSAPDMSPPVWLTGLFAVSVMALLTVAGAGAVKALAASVASRSVGRQAVMRGRIVAGAVVVAAVGVALVGVDVLTLGALAYALAGGALFVPLALSLYWSRATGAGALAGMIGGALAVVAYAVMTGVAGLDLLAGGVIGLGVSLVLTVVVSALTKPPKSTVTAGPEAPE